MSETIKAIDNLHITGYEELPPPNELKQEFRLEGRAMNTELEGQIGRAS